MSILSKIVVNAEYILRRWVFVQTGWMME
jgi:hypothetical protein